MPTIKTKKIGVCLDMFGCPNRCRHCYLGSASNGRMSDDDLRWMAKQFREYVESTGQTNQIGLDRIHGSVYHIFVTVAFKFDFHRNVVYTIVSNEQY